MEPTIVTELRGRLVSSLLLAVVTGLAVALFAHLAESSLRDTASYVIPHQYEAQSGGPVLTGSIIDARAPRG